MCDQDQWDIHKLDPFYDCFVPTPPQPPTIRSKVASTSPFTASSASSQPSAFVDGSKKRRPSSPTSSFDEENGHSPKKRRHVVHVVDSDSDQVEVETTVHPNAHRPAPRTHVPGRRVHERKRGTRYVPITRSTQVDVQNPPLSVPFDEDMRNITPPPRVPPQTTAPPSTSKRRKGTVRSIHESTH
jgi:hypothetical protein